MENMRLKKEILLLLLGLFFTQAGIIRAQEIVAVLSSDSQYYLEALKGFEANLGKPVSTFNLQKEEPKLSVKTKIVVAFGGKAAYYSYPESVLVVTCMTPSTEIVSDISANRYFHVSMSPQPEMLFVKLKIVQPQLKKLTIFWLSDTIRDSVLQLKKAASSFGVSVNAVELRSLEELPVQLRKSAALSDAVLLPPDPGLITVKSFMTILDFAIANHIPLYVPTEGLVEKGATASVASDFVDIGKAAANLVKQIMTTGTTKHIIYPDSPKLTVNLSSLKADNIVPDQEATAKIDKILK